MAYLGEMLIRLTALLALALSACGLQSDPAPTEPAIAESDQGVINTCNPVNYACSPRDSLANAICQYVCGGDGYCLEYSAVEYAWCAAHPDAFLTLSKYCNPSGDPTWLTHCEPGFLP